MDEATRWALIDELMADREVRAGSTRKASKGQVAAAIERVIAYGRRLDVEFSEIEARKIVWMLCWHRLQPDDEWLGYPRGVAAD